MKPGDYYIDDYFEPDTVVLKVTEIEAPGRHIGYKCKVVYTSDPHRLEMGETVTRYRKDKELIPVAMIHVDDKLMIIKL